MRDGAIPPTSRKFVPIPSRNWRFPRQPLVNGPVGGLAPPVHDITNIADDTTVPAVPEPNWPTYNSFRSGDLSASDGLSAPDLQILDPDSCNNACAGVDMAQVWFQLGNTGAVPLLAGAEVEVHGTKMDVESLLTTVPAPDPLQPGEFAPAQFVVIDTEGLQQLRMVAVAKETECTLDEGNELVLLPPFCTTPG